MLEKFGHQPTCQDVEKALKDHSMVRWVTMHRVSPYYVLLSPWVSRVLDGKKWDEVFLFDLSVYKSSINDDVIKFFNEEFKHELNS